MSWLQKQNVHVPSGLFAYPPIYVFFFLGKSEPFCDKFSVTCFFGVGADTQVLLRCGKWLTDPHAQTHMEVVHPRLTHTVIIILDQTNQRTKHFFFSSGGGYFRICESNANEPRESI